MDSYHKTSVVEWSLQNMYQGQNFILTSPSPICMFCFCFGFCHNLFIHLFVCLLGKSMKCLVIQKNSYHKNLWDNGKFKVFFQGGGDNNSTINSNRYPLPSPPHLNLTCGFFNTYLTPVFLQQQNYIYSICRFPLYNHELKEWGHVLIENYLLTPPSLDKIPGLFSPKCMIFATQTEHTKASMVWCYSGLKI